MNSRSVHCALYFFFLFFFHQPFVYLLFFGIILCSWFIFFISFCQEFGKKSFTITKLRSLREKRKCLALFFFFFFLQYDKEKQACIHDEYTCIIEWDPTIADFTGWWDCRWNIVMNRMAWIYKAKRQYNRPYNFIVKFDHLFVMWVVIPRYS